MTKSILTFMGFLLFSTLSFGGNPPAAVQNVFEQRFPNATNVKWDKENAHEYEASFEWKGGKYSANFNESGEWLETETALVFDQLPEKVQGTFNASHKGATIKEVAKIETSKGVIKYEIEIKQGIKTIELLYTPGGDIIKN